MIMSYQNKHLDGGWKCLGYADRSQLPEADNELQEFYILKVLRPAIPIRVCLALVIKKDA